MNGALIGAAILPLQQKVDGTTNFVQVHLLIYYNSGP